MTVIFRSTQAFVREVRRDLIRPHSFAAERVGWISTRTMAAGRKLIVQAENYYPVNDADYIDDSRVGAMMDQEAIRKALNVALLNPVGVFHVHLHHHHGRPIFSGVDLRGQADVMPDFFTVRPDQPHGALVLSLDRITGRVWLRPDAVHPISEFNLVGPRTTVDLPSVAARLWLKA